MSPSKCLIVNADDFGRSAAINRGVIAAFEHGIVTSASLMVRYEASADAAAYARRHADLSVGLHLDLGEWVYREGAWNPLYQVVSSADAGTVAEEVERQLSSFRALVGRDPTHLDAHQHAHRDEPARTVMLALGDRLGVPVRHFTPGIRYCGAFYGQGAEGEVLPDAITVDGFLRIVGRLHDGVTELCCHPGDAVNDDLSYGSERGQERTTLCDPRVRRAIADARIALCSFNDAPRML